MWHNDANVNVYEDIGDKITALSSQTRREELT